jgi:ribosomal protein S18 acetylase RimI-like enzyme
MAEVAEHFARVGTQCYSWVMNPSAAREQTEPLIEHLLARGYTRRQTQILYLQRMPTSPVREIAGLTIIPQRASFRHTRMLADESAAAWNEPQLAEASMSHLDDPNWDALLAMRDGRPLGKVGVLAVGEIGRIESLFVAQSARRQGIGRTMMSRALEICARSLFKHVFTSCTSENAAANELFARLGFAEVGRFVSIIAPSPTGRGQG